MTSNYAGIKSLQTGYMSDDKQGQALKVLTPATMEAILSTLISIGVVLSFRRLLHAALADVTERRAPGLLESLRGGHLQTGHPEIRDVDTQMLDALAHDLGATA
eukprot:CAMPEP_0114566208 /NCGR_PEP_ID=MMETSP0114-20121206/14757_1 /TAXON_ID=31324 /ORGANISM="Goniomonas sp, Strain m" /LENGTH=103 /DNA_ID=CAMNT_0001752579 /DNA_START=199 /DNA_END=507 /DNA_ORIENTATION=-